MAAVHHFATLVRERVDTNDLAFVVSLFVFSIVVGAAMFAPPSMFIR
jgi:hypothetical protein